MRALSLRQDFSEGFFCQLRRLTGSLLVLWLYSKFEGSVMKTVYSSVSIFALALFLKMWLFPYLGLGNYITTKGKEPSKNKARQNKMQSFKPLISTSLDII